MPDTRCAVCTEPIERRPTSVAGWGHLTETDRNADGHLPRPADRPRLSPEDRQVLDEERRRLNGLRRT